MALTDVGKGLRSFITGKPRTKMGYIGGKARCKVCKLRIRGTNHEEGKHHQGTKDVGRKRR